MAEESTSVGKVQLDIEISQTSLNRKMNKLGNVFNSNFKNMFSQTTNFVRGSLDRMTNSFKTFSQVGAGSTDKVSKNINKMNSDLEKTQSKIDETNNKLARLYAEQDNIMQSYRDMPAFSGMSRDESLEQMLNTDNRYTNLTSEIERLESRLQELRTTSDTTRSSIRNLEQDLSNTNNTTQRTNDTTRRAANTTRRFGREINKTGQNAKKSTGKVAGFANMIDSSFRRILKRIFIYNLIYKGIRGVIKYTSDALKTNKQFVHSLNLIKTNLMVTFQPIYDFILPALNALMQAVATATTYIASAISALFGKTYKQSYDSAKGLDNAKKAMDGYGKSAKKARSQLAGFDEINSIDLSKDGEDGAGGFEMTMPDTSTIDMTGIERFKEIMTDLFKPFKLAWDVEGLKVIDAVKYALESIKGLIESIGKSWAEVWTNGTGQKVVENILKILQNIFNLAGNLATAFKNAWKENEVGTKIIQGMFDILNIILETINKITKSTSEWTNTLDFSPLLESVSTLLNALKPLTQNIGDGLVWLWENALLPIAGWVIEDAIPVFLDILSESIKVLNNMIEALKPLGQWLWDNFLKPLAEWTGGIIVSVLEGIKDALEKIGDWIKNNQGAVENMAIAIGSFMSAWLIVDLAVKIGGIVSALTAFITTGGLATATTTIFGAAIGFLTSPITIAIAIIGSLIAVGVLLYKNWDEVSAWLKKTWEGINSAAEKIWNGIAEFFKNTWEDTKKKAEEIWNGISTFFTNTWNNIKTKSTTIFNNIKDTIANIFNSIKTTTSNIWNGITSGLTTAFNSIYNGAVNIFSKMKNFIKGITDSIEGFFKGMVNGVIKAMNTMTSGLNKLNVDIPDWVPGIGGKSLGFNIPKIPMLARGGIVDQPTLAMVGERGKEAVMPLENNTGWITDLASQIVSIMGSNQGSGDTTVIVKIGEDTILDKVISGVNRQNRINGKTVMIV